MMRCMAHGCRGARWLPAIALAITAIGLAVPITAAAEDQPYLVEYRAFRAALDAGDNERAAVHAEAAWQAAEQSIGDDAQTAILAYNYARMSVFRDSDGAREALRRTQALQAAGIGRLDAEEVALYSAFADLATDGFGRRDADRLRERLEAWDVSRDIGNDLVLMWLSLGRAYLSQKRYRQAQETAERAEAVILANLPDNVEFRAQAVLINGVARLLTRPRTVNRIQAAHNESSRARRLFPPQKDLDSFDPMLARILAWNGAAGAALRTLGYEDYPDHDDREYVEPPKHPLFVHEQGVDCEDVEWVNRRAPAFPPNELRRGMIGAVYVGYAVGDDLRVRDARVLAEVPEARFSAAALETMEEWEAAALPAGDPVCYRNLVTRFTFAIK